MGGSAGPSEAGADAKKGQSPRAWLAELFDKVDTIHLTLVGIALYVVVHFSYSIFYGRFGVSPTEVGLTYLEILTRSAPPLVALMAICVAAVVVGRWLLLGGRPAARDRSPLLTVLAVVLLVLFAGALRANQLAGLVQAGSPIRPRAFGEIIDIRVEYVTVTAGEDATAADPATDDPAAAPPATVPPDPATGFQPGLDLTNPEADVAVRSGSTLEVAKRRSLLYLGQANGVAVLYDAVQRQTIRVPAAEVTMFAE
jgi:hypothetical protein